MRAESAGQPLHRTGQGKQSRTYPTSLVGRQIETFGAKQADLAFEPGEIDLVICIDQGTGEIDQLCQLFGIRAYLVGGGIHGLCHNEWSCFGHCDGM